MRTRRTTRRAQVLEAHAVVIGALLSALARLIHRRCRQMRLAAGPACIRRVSPRAHTIPHSTAHTGTCSGAHTCARLPMSTCATSHTHTAPHTRTCACTQPDRRHHTQIRDTSEKTHTHTHTRTRPDRFNFLRRFIAPSSSRTAVIPIQCPGGAGRANKIGSRGHKVVARGRE